jgi:anti-sigma regulatory factor (Ser/Thr protein kinase)
VLIERTLDPGPRAAGAARRALDPLEGSLEPTMLDNLRLMASELVTNSFRHLGRAAARAPIHLAVEITPSLVRLEVRDAGAGFDPADVPTPTTNSTSGWGLILVDAVSDRWGVHRDPGTVVWAEVDRVRSPIDR